MAATQQLIDSLPPLPGCVCTFDALHANHATMEKTVVGVGADFLIQVKGNAACLEACLARHFHLHAEQIQTAETGEKGHGRLERRHLEMLPITPLDTGWPHTFTACRVTRERQQLRRGQIVADSREQSLYIASFAASSRTPEQVLQLVRGHWSIENGLHHRKDRSMDEDRCRASARGCGRVMCCIRSFTTLIIRRSKETASVVRRRFSRQTHLPLALLGCDSIEQWELTRRPYKTA